MKKYNLINNLLGWFCFAVSAVTYLLTIEPTASFWDCPEFISQGAKLEVGHPPGNPIFMLTARFFVTIFGGDISRAAIAVNSMSALLSAATILLLFWTITHLVKKIVVKDDATDVSLYQMLVIMGSGLCGALAYTWSDTFWFSAVEGEVYAFSSFCTALVFWLILKWENHADEPHSDRYLVLIAYVIGVSIAVHLLNLLCIPAIVLVYYYRKTKAPNAKGSLVALLVSVILVALILYGLVPGFVKVAQWFELFFVNYIQTPYNTGVFIYAIILVALCVFTIYALYRGMKPEVVMSCMFAIFVLSGLTFISSHYWVWFILFAVAVGFVLAVKSYRVYNLIALSVLVIFIGYSSYALLLIRASANPPMNQNAPDNVFTLSSYLNRDQYGKTPLLYGPNFAEEPQYEAYKTEAGYTRLFYVDDSGLPIVAPVDATLRDGATGQPIEEGEYKYTKISKASPQEPDKYVLEAYSPDYKMSPDLNVIFPRMHSTDPNHIQGYKNWSGYSISDIDNLPYRVPKKQLDSWTEQKYVDQFELMHYLPNISNIRTYTDEEAPGNTLVWKPSWADNLRYFNNYQLNHMYWRYFMWNFAGRQNDLQGNGEPHLGNWISGIPFIDNARLGDQSLLPDEYGKGNKGHNVFYMLPLLMGLLGIIWQALLYHKNNPNRGIEQFWVVFFLFFMTGVAIVLYLNQTPGQPRERDYAFAGSFYAFSIWVGMGVAAVAYLVNLIVNSVSKSTKDIESVPVAAVAVAIGILVPLQMVSQTWDDHDRSHRYTARDFGENYLNSLDDNAIIFTNGDNDTFPLWYAQEVEGVRPDVRVVNLSYLATDWYANQLTHPYYEAEAVKMLARPTDYAYDRLGYSIRRKGGESDDAITTLKHFYASEPENFGKQRLKVMTGGTQIYSLIDSAGVYKAFDLDPNSTDSITKIPYLGDVYMPGLNGSGFSLSRLLSFDIVANSIKDNFERPVYFATTVPEDYYLGLQPNLSMTGMAYQVTPFANAPASPLADKAYENIVSRFRWGGLDDPEHNKDLYLDETVRRMVASVRNAMLTTAEDLVLTGDLPATEFAQRWAKQNALPIPATRYDMARYLLQLAADKLPSDVVLYDASAELVVADLYLSLYNATGNADDLLQAEAMIDNCLNRYGQLTRYGASLDRYDLENMGYTGQLARFQLPMYIAYKNYVQLVKAVNANPELREQYADVLDNLHSAEYRVQIYPYLYLVDIEPEDIADYAEIYPDFKAAMDIIRLHDATGIDRMEVTNQVLAANGLELDKVIKLNPYIRALIE